MKPYICTMRPTLTHYDTAEMTKKCPSSYLIFHVLLYLLLSFFLSILLPSTLMSHRGSYPVLDFQPPPPPAPDGQPYVLINLCFPQLYCAFMWWKIKSSQSLSLPSFLLSLHTSSVTVVMLAGFSWLLSKQLPPLISAYYPDVGSCTVTIASNMS